MHSVTLNSQDVDHKAFKVMSSYLPRETLGSVPSYLASTLYQRNHKPWPAFTCSSVIVFLSLVV